VNRRARLHETIALPRRLQEALDMETETGAKVCGIIAGVLISDGVIAPSEARLLQRLRTQFGVPTDAIVEPIGDHSEAIVMLRELPKDVRDETVTLIIQAAAVDGRIAVGERIFLDAIARSVKITQPELDKRVQDALAEEKAQPFELAASIDDA
jgi:uncharacterized tellurite resistance protein B-like protein